MHSRYLHHQHPCDRRNHYRSTFNCDQWCYNHCYIWLYTSLRIASSSASINNWADAENRATLEWGLSINHCDTKIYFICCIGGVIYFAHGPIGDNNIFPLICSGIARLVGNWLDLNDNDIYKLILSESNFSQNTYPNTIGNHIIALTSSHKTVIFCTI